MYRYLILALVLMAMPSTVTAKSNKVKEVVSCFPSKGVVKMMNRLDKIDADKRDVVNIDINPKFLIHDGGTYADRFFLREDGMDRDLNVEPDGLVPEFVSAIKAQPGSEICVEDKARAGRPADDEGLYFQMGLSPRFLNTPGTHTFAELEEGSRDGKSYYKKMAPAAFRVLIPDTDHIALSYDDKTIAPQIWAYKNDQTLGQVATEPFDKAHVFAVDFLEDMGADRIEILGGAYKLAPVPSVKTMKKFGFGDKGRDEGETQVAEN